MIPTRTSSPCHRRPSWHRRPADVPHAASPRRASYSSFIIHHSSFPPAFTLVELLVVIGIITTVTALTLPAIQSLAKDNSRAQAANHVRAVLVEARALALAQHRQVGVVFFEESAKYALPVHPNQTSMQLFAEDFNQAQYAPAPANTVFVALSAARHYLPAGIRAAVLNDDLTRGVSTGDEASTSLGRTRAILFDASGRMTTRHGLARPDLAPASSPGIYPWAQGDWLFTTKKGDPSVGMSSPGVFLYDAAAYAAQNIPTDHSGDAARTTWIKQNATVILINANTGALLP